MSTPKRIQIQHGAHRMPDGAVYVGLPTIWANPYLPQPARLVTHAYVPLPARTAADCVDLFLARWQAMLVGSPDWREFSTQALLRLRGRDLACRCALDQPCHADVLLDLANRRFCEGLG